MNDSPQETGQPDENNSAAGPPVLLRDVLFELEGQSDEWCAFVNRQTGEVVGLSSDAFHVLEEGELDEDEYYGDATPEMIKLATDIDGSSNYVSLPDQFEIHEWEIMRDFAMELDNDQSQSQLLNAVHGDRAFRRFKDTVFELGLRDEWYGFRKAALEQIAIRWLDRNNIPWARDRQAT
ncbi:MAG: UPF0158 family protein [Planctomycetaceae bacterium]